MGVEYNYNQYEIQFEKVAARHYQTGGIKEEAKAEGWLEGGRRSPESEELL